MRFKKYRKITMTIARPLNEQDYYRERVMIETREGPKQFKPGDFIARDDKGVWPIRKERIERDYRRVTEPDTEGFAQYQSLDIREACQMNATFHVNGLTGQPGDYLVRSGDSEWPVDREIFEKSYTLIEEA